MPARLRAVFVAGVAAAVVVASPAFALLSGEVSAGRAVAAQLQSGKVSCDALSDVHFEQLGEYVMDRMVGSRAAHEAMNARMTEAMGPGMMGGSGNGGGWGMMSGSGWSWMHNGPWQHMSRSQWRRLAGTTMGARYASGHHGWSTGAVVAVVLPFSAPTPTASTRSAPGTPGGSARRCSARPSRCASTPASPSTPASAGR